MNITPNRFTIAQLFTPQNEQFVVPAYQRRYAWGYNQVAALFDDIDMLLENDNHLFGMLIFHTGHHHGGLNRVELVDGQQRITTLTLLLNAIKNRYKALGNKDKENEIKKMLSCRDFNDKVENKLILGDLDAEDYNRLLTGDFEKVKNKQLLEANNYFKEWLDEYEMSELNKFYYKLTGVAIVIRLDVTMAQDAYKLFETINNRGLRLTATDIIKNFLLGHAAKLEQATLDKVKSLWADIIVNLDGISTDDFFRQYMCSILQRKISKSKVVPEFKSWYFKKVKEADVLGESLYFSDFENGGEEEEEEGNGFITNEETKSESVGNRVSIIEILGDVRKASEIYKKIVFEGFDSKIINRHLNNLNRILSVPTYIYLIHLFQRGLPDKVIVGVLKVLETFMLRRHICESRTSEHDNIFAKLIGVESLTYVQAVKDYLFENLPDNVDFEDSLPKYDFKSFLINRAKYMLERIEYHFNGDTGEFSINAGNEVHLEHIIPETITTKKSKAEFGNWEEYLGNNAKSLHKKFVHKIGNMTLIAGDLNIGISNNPFGKKKPSYKKSSLKITQELADYSDFKFNQVEERGKELAEIALEIWSF